MPKFDIQNPGMKEYVIAAGGAVGVFLLWKWWSNRQAAQAAAAAPAAAGAAPVPDGGTTPTGLGLGALLLWLQDHASSPASPSTTTKTTKTTSRPWTLAQEKRAWEPGRAPGELGKLYIGGKWYSGVPRPPAGK